MAGAGVPAGTILATDAEGGYVSKDEYGSEDIAATVYSKLGMPTDMIAHARMVVRFDSSKVVRSVNGCKGEFRAG